MIRGIIVLLLAILSLTLVCSAEDEYVMSPYTGNLDNVGSFNVADTIDECFSPDYCFVFEDNVLKLYVESILQSQWPITGAEYHLLLDDGVGGFKLLLDDGVGGFFLIIK